MVIGKLPTVTATVQIKAWKILKTLVLSLTLLSLTVLNSKAEHD